MIAHGERKRDRCSFHRLWWWPAAGALSCEDVWWTGKFAGPLLFVVRATDDLARGETQEEYVWNLILRRSDVDDHGASGHPTSARGIPSSEQVAAESGLADAVRTINNLATAQVRKDTPSFIVVKGLGRPKEFTGPEEDFQRWSKKTEAFFACVIKESEMMLEWAAGPTEITTTAIDLEFWPTDTNEDRGVQNLEFVLQQNHTALMALTSYEANDIVANSRKNPSEAWRRLQSDMIRRQEEGNETFCARSFLLDGALFWNSKRGSNAGRAS